MMYENDCTIYTLESNLHGANFMRWLWLFPVNASSIGYIPEANGCYLAVLDSLNWTQAQAFCPQLDPRAHLAVITSGQQNNAIVSYIQSIQDKGNIMLDSCYVA